MVVVVVVARSVSIVVIQVQVLVRRQVQEHRCRWGVLPEDPWLEICWVRGALEEMGSGVRGAAATWACVCGVFFLLRSLRFSCSDYKQTFGEVTRAEQANCYACWMDGRTVTVVCKGAFTFFKLTVHFCAKTY